MTAAVTALIEAPALTVWSSDGVEVAVWQVGADGHAAPGADPAEHGCILLSEPEPFGSGLKVAEVMTAASASELREYAELFA